MGQSCWVLAYSVLLVTLFSGMTCEEPNTSLPWPSVLPAGWSMEWEPSPTSNDSAEWCHAWAYHNIYPTTVVYSCVLFPLFINSKELIFFQISEVPYLNTQSQFAITFTIKVCIVISGLTFEWGMLFWSEIQWFYRGFTRQTVKFLCLKCVLVILVIIVMVSALKPD